MVILSVLNAVLCLAICLRLVVFQRKGATHRPLANMMAYTLIVAAGAVVIYTLFGNAAGLLVAQAILNAALLLALFGASGNVIDLFTTRDKPRNRITEFLRGEPWAK